MAVMRVYKDLKCDSELFMYPDSKKRQAFKIYGTIPVNYRVSTFSNIVFLDFEVMNHQEQVIICIVFRARFTIFRSRSTSGTVILTMHLSAM